MRWRATVAYDGTSFQGWQSQVSGQAVQDFLEVRLAEIAGVPIRIHGAGRTDAGVHADAQVFHFDHEWEHGPEKLLRALRIGLPEGILVSSVGRASDDFHARHSAVGKRYVYRFYEGWAPPRELRFVHSLRHLRLDVDAMNAAAETLVGTHDFTAFGASRSGAGIDENPVKELRRLDVFRDGPHVTLTTEASGYLYKMVRSLAGCLQAVGTGRLPVDEVVAIRDSRVRTYRVPTAPARGLTLEAVFYPDSSE